ncbi:hypothetical protein [Ahrensia sp. R2A130]|uniref:hypothetical protein n=1 Tax=Ahrensia sp. R2A130 TaxID=744979 RepID=UPI0035274B88
MWPLVLICYVDMALAVAWCKLRQSAHHFRLDRVSKCTFLADEFKGKGDALIAEWENTQSHDTVSTKSLAKLDM